MDRGLAQTCLLAELVDPLRVEDMHLAGMACARYGYPLPTDVVRYRMEYPDGVVRPPHRPTQAP